MKLFFDRYDAGKQLATRLARYAQTRAVVVALPRGGVLVGSEIARALNVPLDIVITRKIEHPFTQAVAICAVTEDGNRVCNDWGFCGIDEGWIEHETMVAMAEVTRRRHVFGTQAPTQTIKGKTVIVTDDGIATGLSMKAALMSIRAGQPRKIVLAIPLCPREVLKELSLLVDEVIILIDEIRFLGAVGAYYTYYPAVSDAEVIACLQTTRYSWPHTLLEQHV